ncbi:hypothetical protein AKJ16_DCAP07188 [Drosera capensis]
MQNGEWGGVLPQTGEEIYCEGEEGFACLFNVNVMELFVQKRIKLRGPGENKQGSLDELNMTGWSRSSRWTTRSAPPAGHEE